MTDKPEDRPEERRRTGPLGDDAESGTTRRSPATKSPRARYPLTDLPRGAGYCAGDAAGARAAGGEQAGETEDKETRVIRTPPAYGTQADASPYPRDRRGRRGA